MTSSNKFGFGPVDDAPPKRRDRQPGPMGAAVRETAETVQTNTEAKIEQRRQNAEDARSWRAAQAEGRVLVHLPLSAIDDSALPRDRLELDAVAQSDEMEELKASIRARGQREPIEVWQDGASYQLKKGWRRWTALSQLYAETGEDAFATIVARIEDGSDTRLARYVDMVEENVVREDLTFAEMAQVAMSAADDAGVEEVDADALVGRLYGALHKTKRSYIRAFVFMLTHLGEDLRWPKAVARNLGVDVSRAMRHVDQVAALRADLRAARDEAAQTRILTAFVAAQKAEAKGAAKDRRVRVPKLEFHVGQTKVTARGSECRIVSAADYSQIPRERLERAIKAFEDELHGKARIRTP